MWVLGITPETSEEQPMPLTAEPSLQATAVAKDLLLLIMCVHLIAGARGSQRRVPELELQVFVSHLTRMLGTEPGSSTTPAWTLNC